MIGFALDMDGTVYHGERPIPGAREFIETLTGDGIPFRFVTNNSSHTRKFYADRLKRMGFAVDIGNIITSTTATIGFIKKFRPGKKVFALASPDVSEEIRSSGIPVCGKGEKPDIVLLTFDRTIDYGKINDAFQYMTQGAEFIATHPDGVCPTEDGYDIDIGPFIRLSESGTGKSPIIVGKPNRLMLEMAASEMGIPVENVVMVGDRLSTDILMARDAGTLSVLVLSGETDRVLLEASDIHPDIVRESVGEIIPSEIDGLLRRFF